MSMRSESGYRWLILSMGWLIYFCFGLINTAVAPLVAPIMLDLGLSYTQMGVIAGAWQLVYIFTAQLLGLLIDRLGVYRSLLLGGAIISASSLLRALASGFWGLFFSLGEIGGFLGPFMIGYMRDLTGSFLFGIYSLTVITEATILGLALMTSGSD